MAIKSFQEWWAERDTDAIYAANAGKAVTVITWSNGHVDYITGAPQNVADHIAEALECEGADGEFSFRLATPQDIRDLRNREAERIERNREEEAALAREWDIERHRMNSEYFSGR